MNHAGSGLPRPAITTTARVRQRRQQPAAQVAVERGHPLVGVDQDERLLAHARAGQNRLERVRHRRELTPLDEERLPAAQRRAPCQLAQQRALADAAGPMHQHDAGRRVGSQAALEKVQLGRPTNEPVAVAVDHPVTERVGARPERCWKVPRVLHLREG